MRIRKAVFPAAGLGTRFLPATKAQPKEMLPLVDKPVIQYVIEEAVASGIDNITIVTGRGKYAIEDHFDVSYELEKTLEERGRTDLAEKVRSISNLIHLSYVRQKEARGLGHAVLVTRDVVADEPFAVFLGDDVIEADTPCMRQMMDRAATLQTSILAVEKIDRKRSKSYGMIKGKEIGDGIYEVEDLVEKPDPDAAPSDLAIIGRYILEPQIFDHIEKTKPGAGGEIQLTDALRSMLAERPVHAYRFEGKRYDTGNKIGFLKATVEFALRRDDLGDEFRRYLAGLDLGSGSL
jgi:UTP--glucose-1-phosphate uridylyltransferase